MTKTFSLTLSLAVALIGMAAATPSQAATRFVDASVDGLATRCERHGGMFSKEGYTALCQTPTVAVICDFVNSWQADCRWPGIDNQIAVNRVIGLNSAVYVSGSSESDGEGAAAPKGNGGGGGLQGPDDFKAPDNSPEPNFDGPDDFQMAP